MTIFLPRRAARRVFIPFCRAAPRPEILLPRRAAPRNFTATPRRAPKIYCRAARENFLCRAAPKNLTFARRALGGNTAAHLCTIYNY